MQRLNAIGAVRIEPRLKTKMQAIACAVDEILNGKNTPPAERKIGFVLMTFGFNEDEGRCNYMSNGNREDIIAMLKEQLARFEGSPDIKGTA